MTIATIDNMRRLYVCQGCGEPAVFTDYHEHGRTYICMHCGESMEADHYGVLLPVIPAIDTPLLSAGQNKGLALPPGIRCLFFAVSMHHRGYQRGTVDWVLEDLPSFRAAVYYYYPGRKPGRKWKIWSAEVDPMLPADLSEYDYRNLKRIFVDRVAAQLPVEDEIVRTVTAWEIGAWGDTLRCV